MKPPPLLNSQLPALTGLRFYLAIWVVVHHLCGGARMLEPFVRTFPIPVQTFLRGGFWAVGTFFVLSGFVLARGYASTRWNRTNLIRYGAVGVQYDDGRLLFMAEGPAGIVKATIEGIEAIARRFPECKPVPAHHLEKWFADLNWGPDKIANERKEIVATRTMGRTTEVSADWSTICDIYENALKRLRIDVPDITVAGGHSSHSYVNGTNMYFIYYYNVNCPPEQEVTKYRREINRVICEETLKLGGSVVHHHGMGKARTPWIREEYGTSYYILERLKRAFDPNDVMNKATIIPG